MSFLRNTCDRCYAAKTRCTKDEWSRKCHKCTRAGVACNYSPRGQAGRPLGSTSSNHAPPAKRNDSIALSAPPRRSERHGQNHIDSLDVMAISPDDFTYVPQMERSIVDGVLSSLLPTTDIDASAMYLDDFMRFAQNQDSLSNDSALHPLFDGVDGETALNASRSLSPNLEFASASSTPPPDSSHSNYSNSSSASSSSSSHQPPRLKICNAREVIPSLETAKINTSETLHSRLATVHYQLAMLSESLTHTFNMAEDVGEIYRASRDFKSVLDNYETSDTSYQSIPIGKCHGMTALLILGCYSYLMEAFELFVEKLQQGLQAGSGLDKIAPTTGASPSWTQSQTASPQIMTPPASMGLDISVGSVHVPVSSELTAEIHRSLILQTAQNLKASLKQCVKRMATVHYVTMDVEDGNDDWSPVAKLTEFSQRQLQRREEGVFMYLRQGLRGAEHESRYIA